MEKSKEWEDWEQIGGWGWSGLTMERVPDWLCDAVQEASRKDALRAALYAGTYIELKGKHYRYRLVPAGQGVSELKVLRKPRSEPLG